MSSPESNSTAPGIDDAAQSKTCASTILDEAAQCLSEQYGAYIEKLTVERVVVGVFFTGVMFSDGSASRRRLSVTATGATRFRPSRRFR